MDREAIFYLRKCRTRVLPATLVRPATPAFDRSLSTEGGVTDIRATPAQRGTVPTETTLAVRHTPDML